MSYINKSMNEFICLQYKSLSISQFDLIGIIHR